jgi:predicted aminopeptidase
VGLLAIGIVVTGCQTWRFYGQAIKGQYEIVAKRESIEKLVADPNTDSNLRDRLEFVQDLRRFAESKLSLPVNGHYLEYVELHRPYVVWNVQAAPRFSLEPKTWWYPVVGRLEYRGYFSHRHATNYQTHLAGKGFDVYVGGVDAYSTLGWFKDPVLNTFIFHDRAVLAELIFHELAHQRVFARGDTDFNEAFATTVGQEATRRWLRNEGDTNVYAAYLDVLRYNDQFVRLVLKTRTELQQLYGDQPDDDGKLRAAKALPDTPESLLREKERIFAELRAEYARVKQGWGGFTDYDPWFARDLNNAQLNTIANYYDNVPAFERLLELLEGDLEKFYGAVERLARMPREERHEWLRILAVDEPPPAGLTNILSD